MEVVKIMGNLTENQFSIKKIFVICLFLIHNYEWRISEMRQIGLYDKLTLWWQSFQCWTLGAEFSKIFFICYVLGSIDVKRFIPHKVALTLT